MVPRHRIGGYREYDSSADAAFFCEAFWTHQTPAGPVVAGAAHRVLPDPALSVAFWSRRGDDGRPRDGGVMLIGPKTRPQLFPLLPGVDMAAVRLKLEWVAPILGIDPGGLDNQITGLSSIRMPTIDRLHESLMRTGSAFDAIAILARTIRETRVSATAPSAAATNALEIMRRSGGRLPCDRVAGVVGISMRHLRRQVRDAAGLSPKAYARSLRLARAMQIADRADRPAWADVALRAGYCDQSHLIRECLALATASPQQLHQERGSQRIAMAERSNRP